MGANKRTWHANAMQADAVPDELDPSQQVVHLIARLSVYVTPTEQIGRQIVVTLSRPMLEILAQLAEDVGAVYHVMVRDPANEYPDYEDTKIDSGDG